MVPSTVMPLPAVTLTFDLSFDLISMSQAQVYIGDLIAVKLQRHCIHPDTQDAQTHALTHSRADRPVYNIPEARFSMVTEA